MTADSRAHWEAVYSTKAPDGVSWYRPHLERSLELIERAAPDVSASIIDVGGGESTLADDLLSKGYESVSVLDISSTAVEVSKKRLGALAQKVTWLVADITGVVLPRQRYDIWHDRAVFHFLTSPEQRATYVRQVAHSVKRGGYVIVATFGPDGPRKCSGLNVVRYDAKSLHGEFGLRFRLMKSEMELHQTPFGTIQQFLYCLCKVE